jgi:hypothetical protein
MRVRFWYAANDKAEGARIVMPLLCSHRRHKAVAWIILACTLFAQGALGAVPCLSPDARASDAFSAMPAGCDEAPPSNLCLAHCVAADQTYGHAQAALAPPSSFALVPTPASGFAPPRAPVLASHRPLTRGPPSFLRLCSLLL